MNRESYLRALAEGFEPLFQAHGAALPAYRVTCGWPSRSALSEKTRRIGECWPDCASADQTHEIIISMGLDDPIEVAGVLAHEMVHAAVGCEHGHRAPFKRLALSIGLVGKMTDTTAGDAFKQYAQPVIDKLGPYPHARLDGTNKRKQGTRMIKASCDECAAESENGQGYTVRLTRKWLDQVGPPICPAHKTTMTAT